MRLQKQVIIALLASFTGFSQQNSSSEIIISEENLIQLIQKIKDKRDKNYIQRQRTQNNFVVDGTNSISKFNKEQFTTVTTNSNLNAILMDSIFKRMGQMQAEMQNMNQMLLTFINKDIPIKKMQSSTDTLITKETIVLKDNSVILVNQLKKQMDSLMMVNQYEKLKNEWTQKMNQQPAENPALIDFQNKYNALLAANKAKETPLKITVKVDEYQELVKKYGSFLEKIYFENNSKTIDESQIQVISSIIETLNSNDKIDAYLKGYASQKGSPKYNQTLSLQRTESVKKHLMEQGIHPSRILSQYHGIDYTNNEHDSRRVTVTYIIRK